MLKNWLIVILAIWMIVATFLLKNDLAGKLLQAIIPAVLIIILSLWSVFARRA